MDLLEKKFHEAKGKKIVRHPWELAREMIINKLIKKNYNKTDPVVMDVGCGDGYIITSVAAANPEGNFSGVDIELTEDMCEEMNVSTPSNLSFFISVDETQGKGTQYNGFTLMDVIEHVPDDVYLLQQLSDLPDTKPGSLFFITVPAWQFLFTQHDVFLKHYRRYTIKSLRKSIRAAGLKDIELHYFFFSLFTARALKKWVMNFLKKEEKVPETDLVWNFGEKSARLVARILYFEYNLMRLLSRVGINLPGLSVFGLGRK